MDINIFIFGSDEDLSNYLSSSSLNENCHFLSQESPIDYSFSLGDIVILVSDDLHLIKNTVNHLSREIPFLLLTRKYNWFHLVDYPFLKVITHPFTSLLLKSYIEEMIDSINKYRLLENHIVGNSNDIKKLRSNIILASSITSPINIYGESGTGKTLAAKLIHKLRHKEKDLVYINCANLSSSVADSDLFGHSKGAFTSASSHRKGLISQANNSTLFLDEIGNLPLDKQAKLLDTIENGIYRSIGDDSEHISSFHLITAGQEPLEKLLEKKKLREDFYYRISSFSFCITPLREHKEDIPELVRHYEKRKKITKRHITDYEPFFLSDWLGNIRELIHFLDRVYLV